MRCQVRQLERNLDQLRDGHGTTLRDEPGIGQIAAATLLVEVGDRFRFAREFEFARWCGTGAPASASGEGDGLPVKHRLDFGGKRRINSVLCIASVTQHRDRDVARSYIDRDLGEGKARRETQRAPQAPPRQLRHPPHVERRVTNPRTDHPPPRLTSERPADPVGPLCRRLML
jgi:hypothetical protein